MKKTLVTLLFILFLNGCAQTTSMMGPSYTMVKTGSIFQTGTSETLPPPAGRRRGRPRMSWAVTIRNECLNAVGTQERLSALLQPTPQASRAWCGTIGKYIHSLQ